MTRATYLDLNAEPWHVMNPLRRPAPERTVEEERRHRLEQLAASFRIFAMLGLNEKASGHISARDPELTDHFWINPTMPFAHVKVSDLQLVNFDGMVVQGHRSINKAAYAIHSRILAENPEVISAAHSHSIYGKAWCALGRPLDPITQDAAFFYQSHAVFNEYEGVVLDLSEGDKIAALVQHNKLLLLQNHGLLTIGHRGVDEACFYFIAADRACQVQLLAEAAGKLTFIDHEVAAPLGGPRPHESTSFNSYYEVVVAEQPDFLD
jgi:ribulose-5-phosphate 4-epimerase/fuculose-1-phosphate aldolase